MDTGKVTDPAGDQNLTHDLDIPETKLFLNIQ